MTSLYLFSPNTRQQSNIEGITINDHRGITLKEIIFENIFKLLFCEPLNHFIFFRPVKSDLVR
jgi:hypothetical protein